MAILNWKYLSPGVYGDPTLFSYHHKIDKRRKKIKKVCQLLEVGVKMLTNTTWRTI